ncbi:hypothetical protein CAS74_000489 [Pichia kudriavzevii]|uniref:Uncharacterized protein n=1 Tax=Pichia kudriavzevii TaxID=4909 RepID=A0A1Z8JU66_PICKU|nr:uncharacterized protein C5L36_0C04755 [Pichia kudriavzevii]AWU76544.1 hypothetical protein C5L36_0C04755 [Pichia kudriavzevii]OUT24106.1 hypothetical protein CAS74_000489 [Pichia kudriavzevii]
MAPIAISSLNLGAKHMIRLSSMTSRSSKLFLSYTSMKKSSMEQDYYASFALHNESLDNSHAEFVSTNAGGKVESGEMHFVKNSHNANTSPSDVKDGEFTPTVSSTNDISGHGHSHA